MVDGGIFLHSVVGAGATLIITIRTHVALFLMHFSILKNFLFGIILGARIFRVLLVTATEALPKEPKGPLEKEPTVPREDVLSFYQVRSFAISKNKRELNSLISSTNTQITCREKERRGVRGRRG